MKNELDKIRKFHLVAIINAYTDTETFISMEDFYPVLMKECYYTIDTSEIEYHLLELRNKRKVVLETGIDKDGVEFVKNLRATKRGQDYIGEYSEDERNTLASILCYSKFRKG